MGVQNIQLDEQSYGNWTYDDGETSLPTTVLYPADRGNPSFPPAEFDVVNFLNMDILPETVMFHGRTWNVTRIISQYATDLTLPIRSYRDAPIKSGLYPIVQFMHDDHHTHKLSLPILEHIAARGFIVIASDSPCNTPVTILKKLTADKVDANDLSDVFCPNLLDISDYVRNLAISSADRLRLRKYVSPRALTFFRKLENVVVSSPYALIGHGRGGLYAVYAGDRGGDIAVTIPLMTDPVFEHHFYCPASIHHSDEHCYHTDFTSSTPQIIMTPPWNFTSYFAILADKDTSYNSYISLNSIDKVIRAKMYKGNMWINGAGASNVVSDLCMLALQNKALGTFMSALDPFFSKSVSECEMARAMLAGQREKLKEGITAALVHSFSGSACSEIELLKKTNRDTNFGAYFVNKFSQKDKPNFLNADCGDFGADPEKHDVALPFRASNDTSTTVLGLGVAFVTLSIVFLIVEARKGYNTCSLKYMQQNDDRFRECEGPGLDDGTLKDWSRPQIRETRTISAFAASAANRDLVDSHDDDDGTIKNVPSKKSVYYDCKQDEEDRGNTSVEMTTLSTSAKRGRQLSQV